METTHYEIEELFVDGNWSPVYHEYEGTPISFLDWSAVREYAFSGGNGRWLPAAYDLGHIRIVKVVSTRTVEE